ncbi:Integrase catalytic domain-containing protein [Citrus sinensis]|nr:Integrase catalytic domain-containing protein [Citrus sinensis]
MNKTLTEIIRAMLRTAGLPNSFWAEATKTACYIVNWSSSIAIELKTAMEMWTGKPVDYFYLHAFRCPVYVMYNAQERTKLDLKSRRCIFLGYADGVEGRDKDDSIIKEKSETVPMYVKNNLEKEYSDSSEAAPEHEEQKPVESEAPEVLQSTQDGEPSAFHEVLNSSDVTFWMTAMQKKIEKSWRCPNKDRIQELKAQLAKEFKMKDLGSANKILGMQIHRDRNNRKIWLSQKNYLKKILWRFNMQDCKPISTPLPVNFKLSLSMCPSNEAERKEMSRVPYASAVRSLMFAIICTRPDIAQAVGAVSRYMTNFGGEHWIAVKRIRRYIRGTSDVALCYGGSEFTVRGYVDSDFAGDLDKRKSTTGYVFTLVGAAIRWVSKLQTVVTLYTTEA